MSNNRIKRNRGGPAIPAGSEGYKIGFIFADNQREW